MTNEEAIRRIKEHLQIHQRKEPRAVNITIALAKAITALEEQRVGHWVEIGDEPYDTWECDNCGFVIDGSGCVDPEEYRDIYKYCPNCGAKMGRSK